MPFLAADTQGERARIHWLIRLRWVAVFGVLAVVTGAGPVVGLIPDAVPLFVIVGALGTWNLVLWVAERSGRVIAPAGRQLAIDLVALAGLLYFAGGLKNPFSGFIVVQVILGAILIPRKTAMKIGLFGAATTVSLASLDVLGLLPQNSILESTIAGDLWLWAIASALLITTGVSLWFTIMIMEDLRAREALVTRYHDEAERERRRAIGIVRSSGAAIVVLDAALAVVWKNPRAELVLGRIAEGAPFSLPDDVPWPPREVLDGPRVIEREWSGKDASGRARVYHISAAPVPGPDAIVDQVILVFTDITDRRAAEMQLHRTDKLAALGRLAAGIAHEINTPLGSVRILASEAAEALGQDVNDTGLLEEVREHLADIRQETERIAVLVRRLLDLSHPGADKVEAIDLDRTAIDVVRLVSVRSPRARGRIRTETLGAPPVRTSGDRLRQVLMNVLDNAIDATQDNGGAILVRTRILAGQPTIEVEDQGEGIAEADLARVFEPFFTTKDVGEGTGLGLYVSYEIMKNLGGDITIESRESGGTTVRLSLPSDSLLPFP